jgi:DNA-binding winged helix-turn-helix (wHTH) protein
VSKGELLDLVWPGLVVEENNLQVHISTLRKLLGRSDLPEPELARLMKEGKSLSDEEGVQLGLRD